MKSARTTRASLLLSVAGFGLCAVAAPALAAEDSTPNYRLNLLELSQAEREAQAGAVSAANLASDRYVFQRASQTVSIDVIEREPQIVIGAPGTPTTALDPVNVNGVGQMIIDNQDATEDHGGTIGLCTGTLINPRTVIFAAHCVNSRAASAYGANSGGTPIGFGFGSNNNASGASAFLGWLRGVDDGAPYQTNAGRYMYNVNGIAYNPLSLEPDANSFLYGDVALASLDTPAEGIPTWALLFSQLPQTAGGANGTGYHVNITGYGRNGTGTTGSTGSDFRRRAAENMLGALASINDFEGFIFGRGDGLPQNLYWIDFDDPRRGTSSADPRDFNAWRDNPLPNEGITASGDSGGPLILDRQFSLQVLIGVLSGGYTRFFNGAPANGYGTASFYQPLYLYWDWIAANNPYRYVSNVAGNRNWTDGANWVSTADPSYQIIGPNGTIVNGVPTTPGAANTGTDGKFGEACIEGPANGGASDCYNFATDTYSFAVRPIGTDGTHNTADTASVGSLTNDAATASASSLAPQAAGPVVAALPAPTIANGLPGATGFVPNNSNGDRANGVMPRYFDVTLSAAGTTTLNTTVVVDRLTISGVQAGLNITSTGSLTSLMDMNQIIGTLTVDGTLRTTSDLFIKAGGVSGSGQIYAPYTTSAAGVFAPGTPTTVGTLTFNGNLVMASGTRYMVDLSNGTSDRIAVRKVNAANGTGEAVLGGTLTLSYNDTLRAGQSFTILTSEGGARGTFATPGAISAILRPTVTYNSLSVVLNIVAGNYGDIVPTSNVIASTWAQLLDRNRGAAAQFDGLYGPLDLQNGSTIVSTLGSWSPAAETTALTLGVTTTDANSTFIRNRLNALDPANLGGTLAHYGRPVEVAALSLSPMGSTAIRSDVAPPMVQEGALPETMSGFISGGYLNGDGAAMTGMGGRDSYDGWYVGAGLEASLGDTALIGFAVTYTDTKGTASFGAQSAQGEAFQGTLYGKKTFGGATLDAQVTAGAIGVRTRRAAALLGNAYTLRSKDNALIVGGELGLGFDLGNAKIEVAPRVAARATHIGFGSAVETGGPMALNLQRDSYESYQGRAGLTLATKSKGVRPFVTGTYVHAFNDRPTSVAANLVGSTAANVSFALNGQDKDWGEVSGGLTLNVGAVDLSVSADTTIARSDLSAQTYRGSVTFRF